MPKGRKAGILSEITTILKGELHVPHFLPHDYFNRVSSIIQLSKLHAVLHVHFGAYHAPAPSDSHRDLSSGSSQERVGFIGEIPLQGKWDADAVAKRLIQLLQGRFDKWVYVYDETQAIKTGNKQFGLHFFRNHRYQTRNRNQSKFHHGHQFGALGLLCITVAETLLFPVWVKLIAPQTDEDNSLSVLKRICVQLPLTNRFRRGCI